MTTIDSVFAREILDSRGNPTVEVEVVLEGGAMGRAAVPSGASTGEREAVELRDGDKKRYLGKGVLKAVAAVNDLLSTEVIGEDALDQALDRPADDRPRRHRHKKKLGANAILAVSLAVAKAAAEASGLPLYRYVGGANARTLPVPFMNILNGGAHADNKVDFQEFMIVPHGFTSFAEALRAGTEIFHALKGALKKKGYATSVGDEGGFAPEREVERGGHRDDPRGDRRRRLQVGHAGLARLRRRRLRVPRGQEQVRAQEVGRRHEDLRPADRDVREVGEGLSRSSRSRTASARRTGRAGPTSRRRSAAKVQLVGDDLFVTNTKILAEGIEKGIANSILIKVNQIGTLTETLDCMALAGARRLHLHGEPPLGRDRGRDDRRPRGRHELRA